MDPFLDHQNPPLNLDDWLPYFEQDDPTLYMDHMNVVSPFEKDDQDYLSCFTFPCFDPIDEYLSFWELPLLSDYTDNDKANDKKSMITDSTIANAVVDGDGGGGGRGSGGGARGGDQGGRGRSGRRSATLELEEIQKYFEMPIAMAAQELNVGLTLLKKRCRELNIKRWPYRKLKSLKCLIQNVEEMGLKMEMEVLEEQKRMIKVVPEMELTQRTKRLRQACLLQSYLQEEKIWFPKLTLTNGSLVLCYHRINN